MGLSPPSDLRMRATITACSQEGHWPPASKSLNSRLRLRRAPSDRPLKCLGCRPSLQEVRTLKLLATALMVAGLSSSPRGICPHSSLGRLSSSFHHLAQMALCSASTATGLYTQLEPTFTLPVGGANKGRSSRKALAVPLLTSSASSSLYLLPPSFLWLPSRALICSLSI